MEIYLKTIEDDFQGLKEIYEKGNRSPEFVFQGHAICSQFLKYLIQEYYHPMDRIGKEEKENVLEKSKSLRKLLNFIQIKMDLNLEKEKKILLFAIDSFYIAKTFENDDCLSLIREQDMGVTMKSMEFCQEFLQEQREKEDRNRKIAIDIIEKHIGALNELAER